MIPFRRPEFAASRLLNRDGPIEDFPAEVLDGEARDLALLFKDLATLRTDAPLFDDVDELPHSGTGCRARLHSHVPMPSRVWAAPRMRG